MAKPKGRPAGGRPPGRRGKGGVGPGPGYRTSGTGKGTSHKSSSSATVPILGIAFALISVPMLIGLYVLGYLLHGHGML